MESRFIGAFSSLGSHVQQNYGDIYNSYDERVGIISEGTKSKRQDLPPLGILGLTLR